MRGLYVSIVVKELLLYFLLTQASKTKFYVVISKKMLKLIPGDKTYKQSQT